MQLPAGSTATAGQEPVACLRMSKLFDNAEALEQELSWFARVMDARFKAHFQHGAAEHEGIFELGPPDLSASPSEYARFLVHYQLSFAERLALVLSLVPHLRP